MVALLEETEMTDEESAAEQFSDVDEDSGTTESEMEFRDFALRIVVQRNDFLLPNLIDMLTTHKTLQISPYYQRRARWDTKRKSRLIESLLVNIPIPPVFLYENDFARYEVMDGQQRISAILEYFNNQFSLSGLEILKSLSGKRFHELPREVKLGLERRSLSAIILLRESTPSPEATVHLRRYVFERLNTGGVRLNAQEIRNCVCTGPFNDLLIELSRHSLFTSMWAIPPLEPNERTEPSQKLRNNAMFKQMGDVELVLRVFGLLDPNDIGGGMRSTLDNAMAKYSKSTEAQLCKMRSDFLQCLELSHMIGGKDVFRVPDARSRRGRLSASLFDGLMVALMRNLDKADVIEANAVRVGTSLALALEKAEFHELVVGRANTKESTISRAAHIEDLITSTF